MGITAKIHAMTKPVPMSITRGGKRYRHHGGAMFSKSFRDFIIKELQAKGYQTVFTFTKARGYQIYKRKK